MRLLPGRNLYCTERILQSKVNSTFRQVTHVTRKTMRTRIKEILVVSIMLANGSVDHFIFVCLYFHNVCLDLEKDIRGICNSYHDICLTRKLEHQPLSNSVGPIGNIELLKMWVKYTYTCIYILFHVRFKLHVVLFVE